MKTDSLQDTPSFQRAPQVGAADPERRNSRCEGGSLGRAGIQVPIAPWTTPARIGASMFEGGP
jgi:hypothetical protein